MFVCGIPATQGPSDPYALASSILIPLGTYFQVQDDFLDFSAPPEILGKIGTDIIDNKCSWCINVALAHATPAQRAILDANYGRKNAESEAKVKEIFEQVGIRQKYAVYEEDSYKQVIKLIETIPAEGSKEGLKREVFKSFLDKIYKRQK